MNQALKNNKSILRDFMRAQYSDERLVMLLDHARAGKLSYWSCCCFIGIITADHELKGSSQSLEYTSESEHLELSRMLPGADAAEDAFLEFGQERDRTRGLDEKRIAILVPMILAELRRRNKTQTLEVSTDVSLQKVL